MKAGLAILFVAVLAALRACSVYFAAPAASEAYQWLCAQRLAPAFFDGPPGTALLVWACGDLAVARFVWPVAAAIAGWLVWKLAGELADERAAAWSLVSLNVLPVFNIAAVTVGPEMPAFLFTMAGLVLARGAWRGRVLAWIPAALSFAVAVLFRYEVLLFVAGLLIGVATVTGARRRAVAFGCAGVLAACVAALWLPLRWNAALEWVPVAGGTLRSLWAFEWSGMPAALAAGGVTWAGALLLGAGGIFLVRAVRHGGRVRFLLAGTALAWAWWAFRAAHAEPSAFAALAASAGIVILLSSSLRSPRAAVPVLVVFAGMSAWAMQADFAARAAWPSLAAELRVAAREIPASETEPFFIAENATLAAGLGHQLGSGNTGKYPPVFVPEGPDLSSQFALWPSYADFVESDVVADEYFTEQKGVNPFVERHALFIGHELPQTVGAAFESVTPLRKVTLPSGRELTIFLCLNYQTLPL